MKGHAAYTLAERRAGLEAIRQEIKGRLPGGVFEFSEDLKFDKIKAAEGDMPVVQRFKRALKRDCRYGTNPSVYSRQFSFSQSLRHVYDGANQLITGGVK